MSEPDFVDGKMTGYPHGRDVKKGSESRGFGRGARQRPGHRPDSAKIGSSKAYFGSHPYKNQDSYVKRGAGGISACSGVSNYEGYGEDPVGGDGEPMYLGSLRHGSGSASGSAVHGVSSGISKH